MVGEVIGFSIIFLMIGLAIASFINHRREQQAFTELADSLTTRLCQKYEQEDELETLRLMILDEIFNLSGDYASHSGLIEAIHLVVDRYNQIKPQDEALATLVRERRFEEIRKKVEAHNVW